MFRICFILFFVLSLANAQVKFERISRFDYLWLYHTELRHFGNVEDIDYEQDKIEFEDNFAFMNLCVHYKEKHNLKCRKLIHRDEMHRAKKYFIKTKNIEGAYEVFFKDK